jgi:hypothetical protein
MKNITKAIIYLQMTALCLTAAFAGPGAENKVVPFKGTLLQVESQDVRFPLMFGEAIASWKRLLSWSLHDDF